MGYKVGDKFIIEIKEVLSSDKGTLYRSNFSTLVFDDYGLDKLQKYNEAKQESIKVGDVVSNPNFGEAVILEAKDNGKYNLFSDGKVLLGWDGFALKKTGKQINIEILKTIGKED